MMFDATVTFGVALVMAFVAVRVNMRFFNIGIDCWRCAGHRRASHDRARSGKRRDGQKQRAQREQSHQNQNGMPPLLHDI